MKVLFITLSKKYNFSGGYVCSNRNYQSLVKFYGHDNVYIYNLSRDQPNVNKESFLSKIKGFLIDILNLSFAGYKTSKKNEIFDIINSKKIELVFLDSSLLGIICKKIKKSNKNIKIISFFHNIEFHFIKESVKISKTYLLFYRILLAYFNEFLICKYSDKIISLNSRDATGIKKIYGRLADKIIPISIIDNNNYIADNTKNQCDNTIIALFVGSYFFPNIEGAKWFVNNILFKTKIKFVIVGAGMENLNLPISEQIEVHSNVPDLKPYYEMADLVVLPILSGSGMKVKTAEALMYGKYIVGTSEAFIGYDINSQIGKCCDTIPDFIMTLNNLNLKNKFNGDSRRLFEMNYSFEATYSLFLEILSK